MHSSTTTRQPEHDSAIYWFFLLEVALDDGDFVAAADAAKELRRLGVKVAYHRREREVAHA